MRNVFIVTPEQNDLARRVESVLVQLPAVSGILFAGASVVEVVDGWQLLVVVGCGRNLEMGAVEALVWSVISKDPILSEVKDHMKVVAYRGVTRFP